MGDLLTRSRQKLIRRLTAQGYGSTPSPSSKAAPSPTKIDDHPRESTTSATAASPTRSKRQSATVADRPASSQATTGGSIEAQIHQSDNISLRSSIAPALTVQEHTPPATHRKYRVSFPSNEALHSQDLRSSRTSVSPKSELRNSRSSGHRACDSVSSDRAEQGPQGTDKVIQPSGVLLDHFPQTATQHNNPGMARRKIWIKRPGASPTLVQIQDDDVVDEVRDMVLRKYSNSLGRTFDAPDVTIRIVPRERSQKEAERLLNPEESICRILDAYFPGGQSVDEALLVDVGTRRTPRASPRIVNHMTSYFDDARPVENDTDYFPPMPAVSPNVVPAVAAAGERRSSIQHAFHPHSMAILETGQLPPLPSPGIRRNRPRYGRQHTSSPTIITTTSKASINSNVHHGAERRQQQRSIIDPNDHIPTPPSLPTPPVTDPVIKAMSTKASTPPLDRVASPRPVKTKNNRERKASTSNDRPLIDGRRTSDKQPTYSFLEAVVPPINVLIVEDNPINLKLLEMFAKRLKVRWSTAMNGREAVTKWRAGGFHLVLMDIQLPIMSGLEATKEIRRLERVNRIGVFAKSEAEQENGPGKEDGADTAIEGSSGAAANGLAGDDKLDGIFKSPVIIVALTASSLQSDRHEALAAGCNDFLTKPVSFGYLERKVMEWGCMQALIDFDGWRKWKNMAAAADEEQAKKQANEDPVTRAKREKREAQRAKVLAKMGPPG